MNSGRVRYAGSIVILALCSACAGGASLAPSTGSSAAYVGKTLFISGRPVAAARLSPTPRSATVLAAAIPESKYYEYVINDYGSYAGIFDYPKSTKQVGEIENVGGQGCTNVLYGYGIKTFWIIAAYNEITEYDAPDTPVKTLSDSIGSPSSCALDKDGNLAVGILYGTGGGDVVIYKNGSGSGKVYRTTLGEEYFDGYDNKGNLFADGWSTSGFFQLIELPKDGSTFQIITTSNAIKFPGSVQWDGTYLTVLDQDANAIYRYSVTGTTATLKGTVSLSGSSDCAQTWNAGKVLYCADAGNEDGEVFKYPAGGSPIAVFSGRFDLPLGTVAVEK